MEQRNPRWKQQTWLSEMARALLKGSLCWNQLIGLREHLQENMVFPNIYVYIYITCYPVDFSLHQIWEGRDLSSSEHYQIRFSDIVSLYEYDTNNAYVTRDKFR